MSRPSQPSRFAPYKQALQSLSQRTKTPLPSLIVSFGVLHEITAIAPVIALFYTCRALGTGPAVVTFLTTHRDRPISEDFQTRALNSVGELMEEGEQRAARFGRRYGLWGLDSPTGVDNGTSHGIASDVANAAVAYGITKVSQPFPLYHP